MAWINKNNAPISDYKLTQRQKRKKAYIYLYNFKKMSMAENVWTLLCISFDSLIFDSELFQPL